MWIESEKIYYTHTGREMSKSPKFGKSVNHNIKKIRKWMIEESLIEVADCDFKTSIVKSIDIKNFTPSDSGTLTLILWNKLD